MDEQIEPLLVLVADDSAVARKVVAQTLPPAQYTIMPARSGKEALELFMRDRPAIIITDWMMPDLTGIELCARIRAECESSYAYIILLTTMSGSTQLLEALNAGADEFLTKPVNPEELLARVAAGRRIMMLHREIEAKNRLLEQLALTDPLSGLPNRRAIEAWAERQLKGAARHGYSLSVVIADLDHFKSVNDEFGHEAGDEVLKAFAEILEASVRECDMCARIGGEEFLLVITYAERDGVEVAVERIRQKMEQRRFRFGGQELRVTASFGVANFVAGHTKDFARLVARADEALYAAKRGGRNRAEFAAVEVR